MVAANPFNLGGAIGQATQLLALKEQIQDRKDRRDLLQQQFELRRQALNDERQKALQEQQFQRTLGEAAATGDQGLLQQALRQNPQETQKFIRSRQKSELDAQKQRKESLTVARDLQAAHLEDREKFLAVTSGLSRLSDDELRTRLPEVKAQLQQMRASGSFIVLDPDKIPDNIEPDQVREFLGSFQKETQAMRKLPDDQVLELIQFSGGDAREAAARLARKREDAIGKAKTSISIENKLSKGTQIDLEKQLLSGAQNVAAIRDLERAIEKAGGVRNLVSLKTRIGDKARLFLSSLNVLPDNPRLQDREFARAQLKNLVTPLAKDVFGVLTDNELARARDLFGDPDTPAEKLRATMQTISTKVRRQYRISEELLARGLKAGSDEFIRAGREIVQRNSTLRGIPAASRVARRMLREGATPQEVRSALEFGQYLNDEELKTFNLGGVQ